LATPDDLLQRLRRFHSDAMVRSRVECGEITLHGWHWVIEDGEVHLFDVQAGGFIPASRAEHSGTGPYRSAEPEPLFNEIDGAWYTGRS